MTPIYYDAEFTGLHRNSTLISIGLVTQAGSYFYAEFNDYDKSQVNEWLQKNVIDNLIHDFDRVLYSKPYIVESSVLKHYNVSMRGDSSKIKDELLSWIRSEVGYPTCTAPAQIYTDCYAYDWVLLNDLICKDGLALNLPEYINYIPIDLSTVMYMKGVDPDITREEFISEDDLEELRNLDVFKTMWKNPKHNSLWDAYVATKCFNKLFNMK